MSEATDRTKAVDLVDAWDAANGTDDDLADLIAEALRAERERVRALFLAAADEIHHRGMVEAAAMDDEPDEHRRNQRASRAATYARAEHLIRRAAQDTP